jgi:hypothetical protein
MVYKISEICQKGMGIEIKGTIDLESKSYGICLQSRTFQAKFVRMRNFSLGLGDLTQFRDIMMIE